MKLVTVEWLQSKMEPKWVEKGPSVTMDPLEQKHTIGWKFYALVRDGGRYELRMYGVWKSTSAETVEADRARFQTLLIDAQNALHAEDFAALERFRVMEGVPVPEWKPEDDADVLELARNVEAAHVRDPQSHRSEPVCAYCGGEWPCAPQQIARRLIEKRS